MIFLLLNVLLGVGIIFFSMSVDFDEREEKSRALINLVFSLSAVVIFVVFVLLAYIGGNHRMINILGKVMQFCYAAFAVSFVSFSIQYPDFKFQKVYKIVRYFLWAIAIILIWKFDNFAITEKGLVVLSSESPILGIKWYSLYRIIFVYLVPILSVIVLLKKTTGKITKLFRQQVFSIIFGLLVGLGLYKLLCTASVLVPMYYFLFTYCLAVIVVVCYFAVHSSMMIDFNTIKSWTLNFLISFAIPSLLAAALFAILIQFKQANPLFFWCALLIGAVLLVIFQRWISFKIKKMQFAQGSNYEDLLEEKIAAFDYNKESEKLVGDFVALMKQYTETMHVELLIDNDAGEIKSIHHSDGKASESISTKTSLVDSLAGCTSSVISKAQAASRHEFSTFRDDLLKMFDALDSELIIVLRESRHLFGIISLGLKRRGNTFSDYDLRALTNLYSYFFLFGFYLKNIANQSVIGTVDREIQMSSQIIRSIQDNVDRINVPAIDLGYISQSARSLGGDFIDFIRLTDSRYMMIMGDVSGKGLNASMSMVILKSIIRTLLAETGDFKELIEKVNYFIKYNLPRGTFFAGVFALFDFTENTMYYVNCGLPVLFLYTESYNNVIEIQGDGKVLGFAKKISGLVRVKKIKLNPGDIVLACTDGLLDSVSLRGEFYGKDRVQKLIVDNKTYDSNRMVHFIYDDMVQFVSKEVQDDVTIVSIKMLKPQEQGV
ncbi:MAG: serine/threonine-protein phosphatase [Treponemataceae bacterium]|nr:serine/threonine-protein phosphatase [Treponemataceae bacterium]